MAKTRKTPSSAKGAAKSTVSGPRRGPRGPNGDGADAAVAKRQKTQALVAAFPFNRNKPGEIGDAARTPKPGATAEPADASVTASTLTEQTESPKTGAAATPGLNPGNAPLDRVRVDSGGRGLTTNFGQPIADNQNSLKAGFRGPALLEDFILGRSSRTSTTSAFPSASCTPAAPLRTACSSATPRSRNTPVPPSCRKG